MIYQQQVVDFPKWAVEYSASSRFSLPLSISISFSFSFALHDCLKTGNTYIYLSACLDIRSCRLGAGADAGYLPPTKSNLVVELAKDYILDNNIILWLAANELHRERERED